MTSGDSQHRSVTEDTYIKIVSVSVPANTPWKPRAIQQFMHGLFLLPVLLTLRITIAAGRILWSIEVIHSYAEAVARLIFAAYPQAQVRIKPKTTADIGFFSYLFHAAAPFPAPLRCATDFVVDPIAAIISVLSSLFPGEVAIYEIVLKPVSEEHLKLGEELATMSVFRWWDYLRPGSAASAIFYKTLGWDRRERFVGPVQRLIDTKLNGPLMQALIRVKIKTKHKSRADDLVSHLEAALGPFESEGSNFLVRVQPSSFPAVLSPAEVAGLWHPPTEHCRVPGIRWAPATVPPPIELLRGRKGVLMGLINYQEKNYPVYLPYRDRETHITMIGKTRTGKSTQMHWMAHQDIGGGFGAIVIDPHGDLGYGIMAGSIPNRRMDDVILLDMADRRQVFSLNLLDIPPSVPPEVAASTVLSIFHKRFPDLRNSTRTEDALYAALSALVSFGDATLLDVSRLFNDSTFRHKVLTQLQDPVALEFWHREYEPLSEAHKREIVRPINSRVRWFYRNQTLRRMIGQPHCLDFRDMLDRRKIFLAILRGGTELEAEMIGSILISKVQMAAMGRAREMRRRRRPTYVYIDEAQNFVTTSLPQMLSEAGKHGISLVLANQYLNQLSGDTLDALLGNVGTTIVFAVGGKDAQVFQSVTRPQFRSDDLENLSRFNAVVKMQLNGDTLPAFSMKTRPPVPFPEDAKERVARIKEHSRKKYTRDAKTVDAEIIERFKRAPDEATHGGMTIEEIDFRG